MLLESSAFAPVAGCYCFLDVAVFLSFGKGMCSTLWIDDAVSPLTVPHDVGGKYAFDISSSSSLDSRVLTVLVIRALGLAELLKVRKRYVAI
jgi:hypothetical protein